jgi:phosphate transport system substrate-binding protein
MFNKVLIFALSVCLLSCKSKKNNEPKETTTSGSITILVDESVAPILKKELEIFKLDYPKADIKFVFKPEEKLLPTFLNDTTSLAILPRMLSSKEEDFYKKRNVTTNVRRFAIDGIALITNKDNIDTTITVNEIIDILQGKTSSRKLVFDNAYSSTFRYLKEVAKIQQFPKQGVYAKNSSEEVIKFIAEDKNYIGILGVNWLSVKDDKLAPSLANIKMMGVKNIKGKPGDDQFYKPTQDNLINGVYPFLRNVNFYNCEGIVGLGTGFAVWLTSQRGQLIVLKSGLGPHKLMPRELSLRNK